MIYCYFLAVWILTSSAVAGNQETQYGLVGETVTFRTDIRDHPDDILWKHNGNKVVQFDGNEQTEYSQFQKRVTLDWGSADLEINQLTHSDSGQYELDVGKKNSVFRLNFELKVLDTVTKPTITCNMSDGSSSDKSGSEATLKCSADSSQSLNYTWSQPGKIQPGQILSIPLGTEHDDKVYNCTASNQLSKEIATFTAKDCYPVGAGLITGLIIGVIALLLCVLGAVFCAVKHKACFAKKEKTAAEQPHSDHESDQPSEPLLHRRETRPSSQRLHHLEETVKNSNSDHKDEKHKKLDPHTGKVKKIVQNFEQGLIDPVSIENEVEDNRKKEDSKSDDMTNTISKQTESEERADEQTPVSLENGICPSAVQPNSPLNNEAPVAVEDVNSQQAPGIKKENLSIGSGVENNKDEPKKVKPVVPVKSFKIRKGQANINPAREEEHSGATESGLQSSTAPKNPDLVKKADDDQMCAPENNASLSAAELLSSLAPASPTMASKNDAGENVDNSNKEQPTGQPNKEIVGKSSGSGEGN